MIIRTLRMGDIHLFDYQLDMVCRIHEAFRTHSSLMVQMPMGTGKTHVIASVVSDVLSSHAGDVWIVAHRCELVRQVEATVRAFGGGSCLSERRPLQRGL